MKLQLKDIDPFRHWHDDCLSIVKDNSSFRNYSAGQYIYQEGDFSNHLYVIFSGNVEILRYLEDGSQKTLKNLKANEIFGEIGFFDRDERENDALAKETSEILLISRNTFFSVSEKLNYEAWLDIIKHFSSRLRQQAFTRSNLNHKNPKVMTYNRILELSQASQNNDIINMTQAELGNALGISRSTIIRILDDLEVSGVVKKGNRMIIVNQKKLNNLIRSLE